MKNPSNLKTVEEIAEIIRACRPEIVYTHNLADKHDTHVAVAMRTIAAIRSLPAGQRPKRCIRLKYGAGLTGSTTMKKSALTPPSTPTLRRCSGIRQPDCGRQALRQRAGPQARERHFRKHDTDDVKASYGLDIAELVNSDMDYFDFINRFIKNFRKDVEERIRSLLK